jgi:hypothetical protein
MYVQYVPCVGIQKHFMGAEIPGLYFPNKFSGPNYVRFLQKGIGKLIFNKIKKFTFNN